QTEDLALPDIERHAVDRREAPEALRQAAARDRDPGAELDRLDALGERRAAARPAAQETDECVLEARRDRHEASSRVGGEALEVGNGRRVRARAVVGCCDDDAHRVALDHAVANARIVERPCEERTAISGSALDLERARRDALAE